MLRSNWPTFPEYARHRVPTNFHIARLQIMSAPAANQTISYLARRFSEAGIRLNARHGQNFLIDMNLQRLIVDRAEIGPDDVVLEVGTGTGALSALMAPRAAAVVTVEIDPQLYQL